MTLRAWMLVGVCAVALGSLTSGQSLVLRDAYPRLSFAQPVFYTHAGDGSGWVYVVQQNGFIHAFLNDSLAASTTQVLDLSHTISASSGEEGLLGLAFHPAFASNRYFYVAYTSIDSAGLDLRLTVTRFTASATNPPVAQTGSAHPILSIHEPATNHNGGMICFGADGFLYLGVGDGGGGNDPDGNGQNRTTLLGKILRIDVDTSAGYRIPPDNPFRGNPSGWREEIWAYGLRNPWRFSIDAPTGRLWAGDVGQGAREEIDIIEPGGNYGWKIMEGTICRPGGGSCDTAGLRLPIKDYDRSKGYSVTGGYVYRGNTLSGLAGAYLYGDYGSGNIWALREQGGTRTLDTLLLSSGIHISSFGVDAQNEVYLANYNSGKIFRLAPAGGSTAVPPRQNATPFRLESVTSPASSAATVQLLVAEQARISVGLYDALGREVAPQREFSLGAGHQSVTLDVSRLAAGVYFARVYVGGAAQVQRFVVVR